MDTLSVFQEQSMLLYVNAGLLIVLIIVGVGIFMRLGEVRDALSGRPRADAPKLSTWRDRPVKAPEPAQGDGRYVKSQHQAGQHAPTADAPPAPTSGDIARRYYGGKPPPSGKD